ncbi:MAG: zinc-ribbon domain-containing protein, partial [Tabrizicola sp.]|nr:zinc-ribbon domain-containing protein [Tabrizicola sp.]
TRMRLVCPNCEAKYEVPEDAIPETGRDVQCANCGHAWYQMRPRAATAETAAPVAAPVAAAPAPAVEPPEAEPAPAPVVEPEAAPVVADAAAADAPVLDASAPEAVASVEAEPGLAAPEAMSEADPVAATVVDAVPELMPEPVAETVAAVEAVAENLDAPPVVEVVADAADPVLGDAPAADPVTTEVGTGDEAAAPAAAAAAPAAYAVDDSVLAILREEAEREALARRAEAAKPLEVQADLGIDAAVPARKAVEGLAQDDRAAGEDGDDKLGVRRARLPDVEEINSTLRPTEQPVDEGEAGPMPVPAEGRSSFRSGFLLVMTIAILGLALYGSADALADAVPALAGVLEAYVGFVDSLRLQLDGLMQSATVAINGA